MRIRQLLIAGIGLTFCLVLMRLVMLEVHVRDGQRLDQFQFSVERISRDAASLAVLSQDFLLHDSASASRRWHAVHTTLAGTLPAMSGFSADLQDDVANLSEVVQGLPSLFGAVEAAMAQTQPGHAQARVDMLAGHLVSETRRISDGAFQLAEKMVDLRRARDLENRRVTWATMACFALLMLAIALVVSRRVLRPMAALQAVARAVRSGALEARSGDRTRDEFGGLSRDFDDMTMTLHERTAGLAAALRENEALLSTIRLHAIFSVADRAGNVIEANDNFCAITGYSREELIGQNHRIVNSGEQDHDFWVGMWRTISSGQPWRGEICNRAKDGSLYWVDSIIAPFVGADGQIEKYISMRTDITHAKLAEQRLRATLRENEALLDTVRLHTIFSMVDLRGNIVDANELFCRIAGYSRDELIGQNHRIVNSGVHGKAFWDQVWNTIRSGQPWRGEICNRAKDGSLYWVDSIIAPFSGADGVKKYISIRSDITAAKLAEQKLRASEAFLDRTGRVAGVGGWAVDAGSGTVEWTDQTCRIVEMPLGHRPTLEQAYGYYTPEARPVIQKAVEEAMSGGSGWDLELPFVTATGRYIWVRVIGEVEQAQGKPMRLVGAFQDVTARRELEAALRQKNEVMSSILENLPCGLSVFDAEGGLVASNREYRWLLDLPDALFDSPSPRMEDFIRHDAQRGAYGDGDIEQIVQRVIERARSAVVPLRFERLRPNGMPMEVLGAPMPGGGFVTTYTDVSERKRGEALLQQAHDRFAIAAGSADIGVWEYDVVAGTLSWDERMYRLYGCQRAAARELYALWANSLHPEDRERTEASLREALLGTGDYASEFRIVWSTGEVRHIKANARMLRDGAGTVLRMTGVNIDITDRKRVELELLAKTALLRTVLDSASEVSIIATDPQLNVTVFNAGAERLLGYTSAEMVGSATPILIHDADEVRARGVELSARLGRSVEGGAVFTEPVSLHKPREWTYVRKDGSRVRVSLVVTTMQDDSGEVFGYLGIAHDVTRQKAYEESLRQAMHAARKASLAKSQFLANMSHEIRTPMNAVIGLGYLLEQTGLDAQQKDYLGKISQASKSLLALINDILDLSKVEAGELTIEHAPFNLDLLLHELADAMGVHADAKGITLEIHAPRDLPLRLVGDALRLNQILTNLLANAIKFTDSGGVKLVVGQVPGDADGMRLRFAVQDSGIGIAPDVQAMLFEPFAQGDASMTRRFGGTGLGLSIVKRLACAMGGKVGLSSTPDVGSEFWVEIGFGLAAADAFAQHAAVAPGQRALPGVRVLVADDSEVNLEVARRILELDGALVTLASNGQEACDLLRAAPHAFDVVLMDVQMPVLDGYGATRRIRSELGLTTLPILALTAGALTTERKRASEAGMDDFITKPFDPRSMVLSVRQHVLRVLGALAAATVQVVDPAAAAAGPTWPAIVGIDAADVSARLGGDVVLFRSMLDQFLEEFADIAVVPAAGDAPAQVLQGGRMHKLKGAAGTLGMRAVHRLAAEAETACSAGDAGRAAQCADELDVQLQAMRTNAAAFLSEATEEFASEAVPGSVEADPQVLLALRGLLRQRSLAALDHLGAAAAPLRRLLGKPAYDTVRDHVDKLRFEDAVRVLDGVVGS